jgi:riboflavin synthase
LGDPLHGHLVQGHVDGTAQLLEITPDGPPDGLGVKFSFELPPWAKPFVVPKGSIALDGISLTVGHVGTDRFSVFFIPHTLERTAFRHSAPGDLVNVELDCVAKYLAGLAAPYLGGTK